VIIICSCIFKRERYTQSMSEKMSSQLPPLKSLFIDAWELFKKTWISYLKLVGLGIAFLFLGSLIGILILLPIGFTAFGSHFQFLSRPTPFIIGMLALFVFWMILYILALIVIGILFPVTNIFILQKEKVTSVVDLLKKSKQFFWAYFFTMLLAGLLIFGGIMFFVVPGIVISILFLFVAFEIVLENQSGTAAIARSYIMVKNYFWQVVGRVVLVGLGVGIVNSLLVHIAYGDFLLRLVQIVGSILVGWYVRVYIFLLYKQIRERTTFPQHISFRWIWIVSAAGWIVIFLILIGLGVGVAHLPAWHPHHMQRIPRGAV